MHNDDDTSDYDKDAFSGMDELLCEYVDGTMDPSVRHVFEEYMQVNPELAEHVDNLRETRDLLCRYRCRIHAPFGFGKRLHREVTDDMMQAQAPLQTGISQRLRQATSFTSIFVAMMAVGLVTSSLLAEDDASMRGRVDATSSSISTTGPIRAQDRVPVFSPAQSGFGGSFGSMVPSSPTPVVEVSLKSDSVIQGIRFDEALQSALSQVP